MSRQNVRLNPGINSKEAQVLKEELDTTVTYENWLLLVAANTCVQWGKGWLTERRLDVIAGESCCHDCPHLGRVIMLW